MTEDPRITLLLRHAYGRFDRRLPIGPVTWPFHDLLWIHQGRARIVFDDGAQADLAAPDGVLIRPDTPFCGSAIAGAAIASVCHFETSQRVPPGFLRVTPGERIDLQVLVRMALRLAEDRPDRIARRVRLLETILDGFAPQSDVKSKDRDAERVFRAWTLAAQNLGAMRSLADVAGLISLRESAFRTLHRNLHGRSAGAHLRDLRLTQAEALLATTGLTISEIAGRVGYAHAETMSAAFRRARGMTPGAYRRHSKPFA